MSPHTVIPLILVITLLSIGSLCADKTNIVSCNGYYFDPEVVPSGMIPYEDGWSHGVLFSAPNWLLAQIDQNLTSSVLDYGPTPSPTATPSGTSGSAEDNIAAGFAALEGRNYRSAYAAFKQATIQDPKSADAWYGLGIALESQKRYLSALDAYSQAISLADSPSDNWASYAGKGRVLYNLNRFTEAKTALETAVSQYEKAGVSHPDEWAEINQLLDELKTKSQDQSQVIPSAYIPPQYSEV